MQRLSLTLVLILPLGCLGGKILGISMAGKSHKGSMAPFLQSLAAKGHDVSIFAELYPDGWKVPKGVKDRQVELSDKSYALWGGLAFGNDTEFQKIQWNNNMIPLALAFPWRVGGNIARFFLTEHRRELDALVKGDWDLVLCDNLFSVSGLALVSNIDAPHVFFATSAVSNSLRRQMGYPTSIATVATYMPNWLSFDPREFSDRLFNVASELMWLTTDKVTVPFYALQPLRLLRPDFRRSDLFDLYRDTNGWLTEYPDRIDWPQPTGRGFLPTSYDCAAKAKTVPALEAELESFVGAAGSKGTILMAFGTLTAWDGAPRKIVDAYLQAFAQLPDYRVLWAWKGHSQPMTHPPNVRFVQWLPQPALLADVRTKLFVSHGGLKSFKETLCAAVPVLYMPIFAEQLRNAVLAKRLGYGDNLSKFQVTPSVVLGKVSGVLERSEAMRRRAEAVRAMWMDRIVSAHDEAAHRIDIVLKHKGLPEVFRNQGAMLSTAEFYNLDILAAFLLFDFVLYRVAKRVFC